MSAVASSGSASTHGDGIHRGLAAAAASLCVQAAQDEDVLCMRPCGRWLHAGGGVCVCNGSSSCAASLCVLGSAARPLCMYVVSPCVPTRIGVLGHKLAATSPCSDPVWQHVSYDVAVPAPAVGCRPQVEAAQMHRVHARVLACVHASAACDTHASQGMTRACIRPWRTCNHDSSLWLWLRAVIGTYGV